MIKKIVECLAEFKTWMSNGQGYANDAKYPVGIATAIKIWQPSMVLWEIIAITALIAFAMVLIGWIDLKYIRLHQQMMLIQTRKYNPYFQELDKAVKKKFK